MKPFTHTLLDVFGMDVRYVVPLYQRPYVWRRETHWEPLWDDLQVVLESERDGDPHSHFLGAIVLEQQKTAPGDVPQWLIIDGQQRLTTLQLLLAAAVESADRAGAVRAARLLRRLVANDEDLTEGEARFKVWPTNADRDAFALVVRPGARPASAMDDPNNEIQEAYAFFTEAIEGWAVDEAAAGVEVGDAYERLRVALSSLLKIVSINLEEGDNAQVIFETLNARGTPLLAMDLVKNALFHRAAQEGAQTERLHEDVWLPQLGDEYWREQVRQGRLLRPRAELFLMHWLAMKLGTIIQATELFTTFRSRVLQPPDAPSAHALIEELTRDAAVLRDFEAADAGSPERRFFDWLDVADVMTPIPVALLLYRSEEIAAGRRRRALHALESFVVRRMILGLSTKNYSQLTARLIAEGRKDLAHADEGIIAELRASDAPAYVWPDDDALKQRLREQPLYNWLAQRKIVPVLAAIELADRRSNKVEDIYSLPPRLSIEHVMPRSWRDSWPLSESLDPAEAEVQRNARLDRLGNLTLVSGALNSSLSNSAWPTKRVALRENSLLLMNQQLANLDTWDEMAIDARGDRLAERICALWPGPEASVWNAA